MDNHTHTVNRPRRSRLPRWSLLALAVVALALILSGCAGAAPKPLPPDQFAALGADMARIEVLPYTERMAYDAELKGLSRSEERAEQGRALYLRGYIVETNEQDPNATRDGADLDPRDYSDAADLYQQAAATGSAYKTDALYRIGVLGVEGVLGAREASRKRGKDALAQLRPFHDLNVWLRTPDLAAAGGPATVVDDAAALETTTPALYSSALANEDAATAAMRLLDGMYADDPGLDGAYYRSVDAIVGIFKQVTPAWGAALALLFMALLVKVITMPLTTKSQRGIRDMQRIQPMLKELQEKYKGDKQKQAEEQLRIMREHKVSPLGGCLPMLIQLPIFLVLYQAVNVYAYQFSGDSFLWISSLAQPDYVLLGLYAVSIILSQYLTTPPATDPQQKQMQLMMTYMMPFMLVFILKSIASAFVLYWFFLNVFNSVHQFYLMRRFKQEDLAREAAAEASGGTSITKKGKSK